MRDRENLAQKVPAGPLNKIGFSVASGACFVETSGGGHMDLGRANALTQADQTITACRTVGRIDAPFGAAAVALRIACWELAVRVRIPAGADGVFDCPLGWRTIGEPMPPFLLLHSVHEFRFVRT